MATIDTYQNRIPCWLVWSLSTSGNMTLHAICLEQGRANAYRKALIDQEMPQRIRVWVDKSEANHLFCYDVQNALPAGSVAWA